TAAASFLEGRPEAEPCDVVEDGHRRRRDWAIRVEGEVMAPARSADDGAEERVEAAREFEHLEADRDKVVRSRGIDPLDAERRPHDRQRPQVVPELHPAATGHITTIAEAAHGLGRRNGG